MSRDRYLSDQELAAFLRAVRERRHVNQPRDHAFFALLANTGIRPSEALALTVADVHLEGPEPWIQISRLKKRRPTVDELQITTALAAVLCDQACRVKSGRLFVVGKRQVERLFHFYARKAGIASGRWLYSLRHTAATRLYRVTRDIELVRTVLGHERADMTCIYAHVTRSLLRESIDRSEVVV